MVLTSLFAMATVMSPEDKKGLVKCGSYEALSDARTEHTHIYSSLYDNFEAGIFLAVLISHIVALPCT